MQHHMYQKFLVLSRVTKWIAPAPSILSLWGLKSYRPYKLPAQDRVYRDPAQDRQRQDPAGGTPEQGVGK